MFLYDFAEVDTEGDILEGVPCVDVPPITHVPDGERLLDLAASMPFGEAFYQWGREVLGRAEAEAAVAHIDAGLLAARATEFVDLLSSSDHGQWQELQKRGREILRPFVEARISMRQTAVFCGVDVSEVVKIQRNGFADAERMCDLEEALLDGALQRMTQETLLECYGLSPNSKNIVRSLCEMHAINARQEAKVRSSR